MPVTSMDTTGAFRLRYVNSTIPIRDGRTVRDATRREPLLEVKIRCAVPAAARNAVAQREEHDRSTLGICSITKWTVLSTTLTH
jgi:hypothetical protein